MVALMVAEAMVAVVAIILIEGRKTMALRSRLALGVPKVSSSFGSLNQIRLPPTFATQDAMQEIQWSESFYFMFP